MGLQKDSTMSTYYIYINWVPVLCGLESNTCRCILECILCQKCFMVHDEKKSSSEFSKSLWIFNHGTNTKNQGICTTFTYFFSTCTNKLHHFDTTTIARSSVRHSVFVCIIIIERIMASRIIKWIAFKTLYRTISYCNEKKNEWKH